MMGQWQCETRLFAANGPHCVGYWPEPDPIERGRSGASIARDPTYRSLASLAERDAALKTHNQPPLGDWRGASKAKVTSRKFVNARTVLDKFGRFNNESVSSDDKWHAAI